MPVTKWEFHCITGHPDAKPQLIYPITLLTVQKLATGTLNLTTVSIRMASASIGQLYAVYSYKRGYSLGGVL